jgi:hypothetical protein
MDVPTVNGPVNLGILITGTAMESINEKTNKPMKINFNIEFADRFCVNSIPPIKI